MATPENSCRGMEDLKDENKLRPKTAAERKRKQRKRQSWHIFFNFTLSKRNEIIKIAALEEKQEERKKNRERKRIFRAKQGYMILILKYIFGL